MSVTAPRNSPRWDNSPITSFQDLSRRVESQLQSNGDTAFVTSLLGLYCETCESHTEILSAQQNTKVLAWKDTALRKGLLDLVEKIETWRLEHSVRPAIGR